MTVRLAMLALGLAWPVFAETPPLIPLLPPDDASHVHRALDALVMTPADARFEKDVGKPQWALGWVTNALADPWILPHVAERIYAVGAHGEAAAIRNLAAELMEVEIPNTRNDAREGAANYRQVVELFAAESLRAGAMLERAWAEIAVEDRVYLAAPVLCGMFEAADEEASQRVIEEAGIARTAQERVAQEERKLDGTADSLAWLALAKRVDRGALWQAAGVFQDAVLALRASCAGITNWPDQVQRIDTAAGRVIVGTTGSDRYEGAALLVLDPGGDDVYADGPGAANGLLGTPLAAVVDLGGNDRYVSRGLSGAGSALWGVAVLHDAGGDDVYEAAYGGGGAALFGAAWLEDAGGCDRYRAQASGQGAATAGVAVLLDHAGDDLYETGFYGQGFAGVMGLGWLIDREGHDRYFAGNVRKDHERNDDRFLSLAQGFSIGMRPHAGGGVGALVDVAGNDVYSADVYGQGVSYYYAAGFLLDGAGNDRYSVYQYGQGCGIHLSHGLLADAAGDDVYSGHILAQGAAHDYAVGMLFDHAGDDTYTGDHHVQGRALNNSFAMLIDRAGRDGYFARQRDGGQGIGNDGGFRDYGSLALLIDLGGADIYSGGFTNGGITLRPLYGVVYDFEEEVPARE